MAGNKNGSAFRPLALLGPFSKKRAVDIARAVEHADDLHAIGRDTVKNEVGPLHQHSRFGVQCRARHAHLRPPHQHLHSLFDAVQYAVRGGGTRGRDGKPYVEEIGAGAGGVT